MQAIEIQKTIIGKRLKKIRKNLDFTQQQMADLLGINRQSYAGLEVGRSAISFKSILSLKEKQVNFNYLFHGIDKPFLNDNLQRGYLSALNEANEITYQGKENKEDLLLQELLKEKDERIKELKEYIELLKK